MSHRRSVGRGRWVVGGGGGCGVEKALGRGPASAKSLSSGSKARQLALGEQAGGQGRLAV